MADVRTEPLIGPAAPTLEEFNTLRANRDAWARQIARDFVRGWEPDTLTRETFAHLDASAKTAFAILKACR